MALGEAGAGRERGREGGSVVFCRVDRMIAASSEARLSDVQTQIHGDGSGKYSQTIIYGVELSLGKQLYQYFEILSQPVGF